MGHGGSLALYDDLVQMAIEGVALMKRHDSTNATQP
jgi:hypothetical protein